MQQFVYDNVFTCYEAGYLVDRQPGGERVTYLEVFLGESAAELLHAGPVHGTQSLLAAAVVVTL